MTAIINNIIIWLSDLFDSPPIRLAIVRKYADANGHYIGELYILDKPNPVTAISSYRMIGASLDSLPLVYGDSPSFSVRGMIDTENDFLAPIASYVIRVGALDPKENDNVRRMVAKLPQKNMTMIVQNRFIEHVLDMKAEGKRG